MMQTAVVAALAGSVWEKISNAIHLMQRLEFDEAMVKLQSVGVTVAEQNSRLDDDNPDEVFNEFFVFTEFINLLLDYVSYWKSLAAGSFSDSWDTLQDIQSKLRFIYRFTQQPRLPLLRWIERQCGELEKLYPYQIFYSVGMISEDAICSICGKSIDSFDCEHLPGELYRGQLAYGIVKKIREADHIAMVTNPEDKRCVTVFLDSSEDFKLVRYLSELVKARRLEPLRFSHLEFRKIKVRNTDMPMVGINELCSCGSGKKYKNCCINKEFIESDHVDIIEASADVDQLLVNTSL